MEKDVPNDEEKGTSLDDLEKKQYLSSMFSPSGVTIQNEGELTKHIPLPSPTINIPDTVSNPVNVSVTYNIDARTQIVKDERTQNHNEYHTTLAAGDSVLGAVGGILGKLLG